MNDKLIIAVLHGTSRPGALSAHATRFVANIGWTYPNVEVVYVSPSELNLPFDGNDDPNRDPHFTEITSKADGFFIVSPEYNHGYPGSLKRMIDAEYKNYYHKPVAVAGVSNGAWGGARMVENLLPTLHTVGLVIAQHTPYFPRVQDLFDAEGALLPEHEERYTTTIRQAWDELILLATALRPVQRDGWPD